MKKIIVIPARGGSKRIPRKNIKNFYGKPIISYSIENASKSNIFNCIHVSTDDQEIYGLSTSLGFKPLFFRSKDTASDLSTIRDVLRETVIEFEKRGYKFDIIFLLSATSPLIDENDIKEAFNVFINSTMQYPLLAVSKYPVPIEWALKNNTETGYLEPLNENLFFSSSHDFKDNYYDTGSFAIFTRDQIFNEEMKIKFTPYILPYYKSIDVDDMDDWKNLEMLYKAIKK